MLAERPPMGFNTWNTFGRNINDEMIRETADAIIEKGLRDAGYEYLVIDDCWSEKQRDSETDKIIPDHIKFPYGMKAVSDYVHSKGLKFGMYSCAGVRTCDDYPSSYDHEYLDAETFAQYGADFLKYDFCNVPSTANGNLLYYRMSNALKACGREILFSTCNWGINDIETWVRSCGAHMYRSAGDINDSFPSMRDIVLGQIKKINYSATGCFNDMDMLTIGMYGEGNCGSSGCNDIDYKTQFALWCMFSCPLMLGADIRKINDYCLNLVKNKNLIRIDQDIEARPPYIPGVQDGCSNNKLVFVKVLSDNEYALLFVNLGENKGRLEFYFENMGIPLASGYGLEMTDCFTGENIGVHKEYIYKTVEPHDCACYLCKLSK